MNKAITHISIIIIVLALSAMACVGGGGGGGDWSSSGDNRPDATATFGTRQLHIQLTAIAQEGK